eukprot:14814.XXX_730821_730958_1 [CDS] Oithona nana genome sequencing.
MSSLAKPTFSRFQNSLGFEFAKLSVSKRQGPTLLVGHCTTIGANR